MSSKQTHIYDSFHVQAKLWSEALHIDSFHGLLVPWQWRRRAAAVSAEWRKAPTSVERRLRVREAGWTRGLGNGVWLPHFLPLWPSETVTHMYISRKKQTNKQQSVSERCVFCGSFFWLKNLGWLATVLTLLHWHKLVDKAASGGWVDCNVMAVIKKIKIKTKIPNCPQIVGTSAYTHVLPQGTSLTPQKKYLAECEWLKDDLWPLS